MEREDEVSGNENSYDFGARSYDPRLGRMKSIDPMAEALPSHSPYHFALNNPIYLIDAEGEFPKTVSEVFSAAGIKIPPLAAGIIDGATSNFGPIALASLACMAAELAVDADARNAFVAGVVALATDPIGTLQAIGDGYTNAVKRLISGTASDEDKYMIGEAVGALGTGGFKKLFKGLSDVGNLKLAKGVKVDVGSPKNLDDLMKKADDAKKGVQNAFKKKEKSSVHKNSINSLEPTQKYTITDQNGKVYHGVGDIDGKRAKESLKKLQSENPDIEFEITEQKNYPDRKSALVEEQKGIDTSGGTDSDKNYNKNNNATKKLQN